MIQVANKADPASALMEFTVKWERQVLNKDYRCNLGNKGQMQRTDSQ